MSGRYNFRNTTKNSPKRKRSTTINDLDGEDDGPQQLLKVQSFLKTMINQLLDEEKDNILDEILTAADEHMEFSFNENLQKTSKKFAKMTMQYIKKSILSDCHDMLHEHLDEFDLSMSTDKFKQLISEVIQKEFGGKLNGKTPKSSNKSHRIKIIQVKQPNNGLVPPEISGTTQENQGKGTLPEIYDEHKILETNDNIAKHIVNLQTTNENKIVIYKEYIQGLSPTGKDKRDAKQKEWLDAALKMPYDKIVEYPITINDTNAKINSFMLQMKRKLDNTVFGLDQVKEEMMIEVMKRITNKDTEGKIIVLVGPPGIGKTFISRNVSECLGIPFSSFALGGCRDASILTGHDFTYVGSHPGVIARSLMDMKCCNGLLYLDEIDKINDTPRGQEVNANLLSILDETQNSEYTDNYLFKLKHNLSKLFVIGSANYEDKIDPILKNRTKIIKLPTPCSEDKVKMARTFFIPKYLKQFKVDESEIVFNDDIIKYILQKTKDEPGVRELKRAIEHIVSRFNILRKTQLKKGKKRKTNIEEEQLEFSFSLPNFQIPLDVNREVVDVFMKKFDEKKDNAKVHTMYM